MTKYKVVGDLEIAGATKGETVDLDPEHVNIPGLIAAGHIEEIKSSTKAPTRKGAEE